MPVTIKKPIAALELAPARPAPPGLTRAEVDAMLADRDALWAQQLAVLTQALTQALAARPEPPPRKGASIKFKHDVKGQIIGAEIVPKE